MMGQKGVTCGGENAGHKHRNTSPPVAVEEDYALGKGARGTPPRFHDGLTLNPKPQPAHRSGDVGPVFVEQRIHFRVADKGVLGLQRVA
jgi:hypothetical protein